MRKPGRASQTRKGTANTCAGMTEADSPNIEETFKVCKEHIAPERLKGFLVMPWSGVDQGGDKVFYNACDKMKVAIAAF